MCSCTPTFSLFSLVKTKFCPKNLNTHIQMAFAANVAPTTFSELHSVWRLGSWCLDSSLLSYLILEFVDFRPQSRFSSVFRRVLSLNAVWCFILAALAALHHPLGFPLKNVQTPLPHWRKIPMKPLFWKGVSYLPIWELHIKTPLGLAALEENISLDNKCICKL